MKTCIIALGGCGHNQLQLMMKAGIFAKATKYQSDLFRNFAKIDGVKEYRYQGDHADGSGRDRRLNLEPVRTELDALMNSLPPEDVVIMLHSLGGGSGNVIASHYATKAAAAGKIVISLGVASFTNTAEIENTIGATLSLEKAVSVTGRNILTQFSINGADKMSESDVDKQVLRSLGLLELLFGGISSPPDGSDLRNWAQHHNVSKRPVMLSALIYMAENDRWDAVSGIDSVITLTTEAAPAPIPITPAFSIMGRLPEGYRINGADGRLSYCLSSNHMATFMEIMREYQAADKASKASVMQRKSLLSDVDPDDVI
jgi:hypothetical protein